MNKQIILETIRSWAGNRFTDAAGKREVLERNTPPPSVDIRAGLAVAPKDSSGVFFFLQADENKSLQVWLSSEGLGNAYTFMDEENDEEQQIMHLPQPASPKELTAKLTEIVDRFMRTLIFEPALDEWVGDNGGVYEFEQISEFCGEAGYIGVNPQDWTFFRYTWPSSGEVEVIAGFDGSGNAATFYQPNDSDGFYDLDEKISEVHNAEQFRAWLDKVVGRPTTMTIQKVEVEKLFGYLSYSIPLKIGSSATIIHAPNGCGKTTVFNLVLSLLKGRFGELCQVRFDSLALEFEGGRRLLVKQVLQLVDPEVADAEERRRRRIAIRNFKAHHSNKKTEHPVKSLSVELFDKAGKVLNRDEIPIERIVSRSRMHARNAALRIARRSLHLRGNREGVFDSSTDEFLSFEEVLERYSTPGAGEAKEWLSKLLARNEVHLIRTKRLDAEVVLDRDTIREESETIPAAVKHAKEISLTLKKKLSEFSNVSRNLDEDFLNQLIGAEKIELRVLKDLQNDLSEVARTYGRIAEAGILGGNPTYKIPQLPERASDDPTLTKALGLYIMNQRKKLKVFDEILPKIETLKSLVNERFQMKHLMVSPDDGYTVISEHDKSQIPLDGLSSGEQHQLVLFHSLIFEMRPGALIMIDEPEISLHVAWQQVFLRDLQRIASNTGVHFLIATHSPQIIDDNWDLTVGLAEQITYSTNGEEKEVSK